MRQYNRCIGVNPFAASYWKVAMPFSSFLMAGGPPRAYLWGRLSRSIAMVLAFAVFAPLLSMAQQPNAESPRRDSPTPLYRFSEGKAQVGMFGLVAEGYKFVYVIDRSGSMGDSSRAVLRAVTAELARSLETLDSVHQFQIVFYNEKPVVFNPTGVPGKLPFATDDNKRRALRFIDTITPDGGTRHDAALKLALGLRPDVIFFLTDGDKPQLTEAETDKIVDKAVGTAIHVIQFGLGSQPLANSEGFLKRLVEKTRGQYTYVDLTAKIAPAKKTE